MLKPCCRIIPKTGQKNSSFTYFLGYLQIIVWNSFPILCLPSPQNIFLSICSAHGSTCIFSFSSSKQNRSTVSLCLCKMCLCKMFFFPHRAMLFHGVFQKMIMTQICTGNHLFSLLESWLGSRAGGIFFKTPICQAYITSNCSWQHFENRACWLLGTSPSRLCKQIPALRIFFSLTS